MKPIILICGEAGSGKDTVANLIKKHAKAISIAQADPMKRLGSNGFGFTEDQLWGPSESRNTPDERYKFPKMWENAWYRLTGSGMGRAWIFDLGFGEPEFKKLQEWFFWLAEQHGLTRGADDTLLGLPNKLITPRFMLQTIGTEWGRKIDTNMWSRHALGVADYLLSIGGGVKYERHAAVQEDTTAGIPDLVLITDGRFPNEVINAASQNCHRLLVVNPKPSDDQAKVEVAGVKGHQSEAFLRQIPAHWYSAVIVNDKDAGLQALEEKVRAYLYQIMKVSSY